MKVDTQDYERTHARKPSGIGAWAFHILTSDGWVLHFVQGEKTMNDAKKTLLRSINTSNVFAIRLAA